MHNAIGVPSFERNASCMSGRPLKPRIWARRSGERLYLFLINDTEARSSVHVHVHRPDAFGIESDRRYRISDAFSNRLLCRATGAKIAANGIDTDVRELQSAVLMVEPDNILQASH